MRDRRRRTVGLRVSAARAYEHVCVNADWSCIRFLVSVVVCALELRIYTGVARPVRAGRATFADDSLTMIMLGASPRAALDSGLWCRNSGIADQ
jgi:hypothetical protein